MIYTIRGNRVMLDSDLAKLYGVKTKVLNQAVRRNLKRFPEDFMIECSLSELEDLRSQTVTANHTTNYTTQLFKIVFEKLDNLEEQVTPKLPANRKKIGLQPSRKE